MIQNPSTFRQEPAVILLVEDDDADAYLARECIKKARQDVVVNHVKNGEHCLAYLKKEGKYAEAPTPTLVLLDLNMPGMDGRQVMKALHADGVLGHLTVVVLTSSTSIKDIGDLYNLGCRSYITKPSDLDEYQRKINDLCAYWLGTVELPIAPGSQ